MTSMHASRATQPTAFEDLTTLIRVMVEGADLKDDDKCIRVYFWLSEKIQEDVTAGRKAATEDAWNEHMALTEEQSSGVRESAAFQRVWSPALTNTRHVLRDTYIDENKNGNYCDCIEEAKKMMPSPKEKMFSTISA